MFPGAQYELVDYVNVRLMNEVVIIDDYDLLYVVWNYERLRKAYTSR